MSNYVSHRITNCVICAQPLAAHGRHHQQLLCLRLSCQQRHALLRQRQQLCRVCQRPIAEQAKLLGICSAPACRRTALAQQARAAQQQRVAQEQRLHDQAAQLRERVLKIFGIRQAQSFPLLVTPAVVRPVTRLPRQRVRYFRTHLQALIQQASTLPAPALEAVAEHHLPNPHLQAASQNACACCQGFCCLGGGHSHAYLKAETLQIYIATHPHLSPRQVLREYVRHIGAYTYKDSCIYHQANGCSLPGEMRAAICGNFYCEALQRFRSAAPTTGMMRSFCVATDAGEIQRAALIHAQHTLLLPNIIHFSQYLETGNTYSSCL